MRLQIERQSARVWFHAPDQQKTSLVSSDAECLADLAARMADTPGSTDVRIGGMGLARTSEDVTVSLYGDSWSTAFVISSFEIGSFARMVREAATSRIFTGSIGVRRKIPVE